MRAPFQRHFDRLSKHYDNGSIVVVNLIDQKGCGTIAFVPVP